MNNTINRYLTILCFPFNSIDFFWEDYFAQLLQTDNCKGAIVKELKEKVIKDIQRKQFLYSYDEVYLYLESCFLYELRNAGQVSARQYYMSIIDRMADSMISQRDGKIVYKYWRNQQDVSLFGGFGEENKIFLFHSLNSMIPLDTIVMAFVSQNSSNSIACLNNYYSQIEIADQQLEQVLKKGVAENHLHRGVARFFLDIWEAFMQPLDSENINYVKNINIKTKGLNIDGKEILCYILSAAVVRYYIAEKVVNGQNTTDNRNNRTCKIIKAFYDGSRLKTLFRDEISEKEVVSYFLETWEEYEYDFQEEYNSLIRNIFRVPGKIHTSDENIFLFYTLKYFREEEKSKQKDELFKLFLQYLRIKNVLFGCTVQEKTVRGLDYFQQEYYGINSMLTNMSTKMLGKKNEDQFISYWEQLIRKQFQNQNLKKIEFRTSISSNENDFRWDVCSFLKAYRKILREDYCVRIGDQYKVKYSFPRVGLIFHLLKHHDETVPEKCIVDGYDNPEKMQFGKLINQYEEQIQLLKSMRDNVPGLDRYIVGIDAASIESATPLWVFKTAFDMARDSKIERMGYSKNVGSQSLRFTFHAGEDFRHMLSGLRRMDETVTCLKFHAGDRIGHGTALGIDPEKWKRYNPIVILPRIEALENYLWAYYVLSNDNIEFQATLMAYLERKVFELASDIYGNAQGITMQILVRSYLEIFQGDIRKDRQRCERARENGFCDNVKNNDIDTISWNVEKLVNARHCKKFLKEMDKPISYEVTTQDMEITSTVQRLLKKKLSRAGIVIEVNPTSNVAIGEIDKITDHQIYQLNRPHEQDNIMVCVNSDDPSVFNTNVSNELAYIYYGMLRSGISREEALEWIEKIRKCGIDASFISLEESEQTIVEQLDEIILQLEAWSSI